MIDYHALFLDACSQRYPSPLVYWAAQQFGHFELKKARWRSAEPRWRKIVDELLADEPLPAIPSHLIDPPPVLNASPKPAKDSLDWARKVIANPLRYPSITREFARKALEGSG